MPTTGMLQVSKIIVWQECSIFQKKNVKSGPLLQNFLDLRMLCLVYALLLHFEGISYKHTTTTFIIKDRSHGSKKEIKTDVYIRIFYCVCFPTC